MKLSVNKRIACMVLLSFLFSIVSSAYPGQDSAEKEGIRLLTLAEAYYRNIKYRDALQTFLQAEVYLKSEKHLTRLYLGMSKSRYALNDTANIKSALKKLFEIDPDINIDEGEYPRGYLKIFEETRAEVKAELANKKDYRVVEKPAGKKKRKFPWLLVVGGAVLVGVIVYFLLKKKPSYTLAVTRDDGVDGSPDSGSYTYKKNTLVDYHYTLQSGYADLVVLLDGKVAPASGQIKMDTNHTLMVSTLKMAAIHLESFPAGAEVFVDDTPQGVSTPCTFFVTPASHEIRLWKQDYGQAKKTIAFQESTSYDIHVAIEGFTYEVVGEWGGTEGSGDGQFHGPAGIAVDSNNRVYVVDLINSRIQKFDANGNFIRKWGSFGGGDGRFRYPNAIAIDRNNDVYIADGWNNRIQKFDANGKFLRKWGSEGRDNGRFDRPEAIAVDNNSVYVCDLRNERIQIFDYNGNFKKKWEYPQAQQWGPAGIAIDNSNYVYVVDDIDLVIQKFNASGNFIGEWGCYRLICPRGDITVDDHNNLYAAADSIILKIDTSGHFVTAWGRDESDPRVPVYRGVAVDQKGFVYATDGRYDRVQKFKRSDSETNGDGEWDIDTSAGAGAGLHRARQYKSDERRNETQRQ
jgi:DNA-binding beta-propeller fold protein YncE